jgi:GT2 family glycosyltransferase
MLHAVIVSYCTWEELEPTINSFYNSAGVRFKLYVADNRADEGVQLALESFANASYHSFDNIGYGEAFNAVVGGMSLLESDCVIIANDDVTFGSSMLQQLVAGYDQAKQESENIGPVSPRYLDDMGKRNDQFLIIDNQNAKLDVAAIQFNPAALWLMDVHFLKNVGGFAPGYFMYGEDRELAYRSQYFKFQPVLATKAHVVHNFDYPIKDPELRGFFERNVFGTQYIKSKTLGANFPWFVLKSLMAMLLTFNLIGFSHRVKGYIAFLRYWNSYKRVVNSIKEDVKFRFIPKP